MLLIVYLGDKFWNK